VFLKKNKQLADERVSKGEHHSDTDTDQEGGVDKTSQEEHLGLESFHELGLASGGFKVLRTHDTNTKAGTDSTKTNNQATSKSHESDVGHLKLLNLKKGSKTKERKRNVDC